jgi:hypothetical protein
MLLQSASPRLAEFAIDLIINSTHVLLVATQDLIDRHAVEAVSIGWLIVTACSDNGSLDDPSGRIGRHR